MAKRQLKKPRRLNKYVWCYDFAHLPRFLIQVSYEEWLQRKYGKEMAK